MSAELLTTSFLLLSPLSLSFVCGGTAVPVELLSLPPSNPLSYLMLCYVIILIDLTELCTVL